MVTSPAKGFSMTKFFFMDTETTGTDPKLHGLVQVAGILEVDGEVVEEVNIHMHPFDQQVIEDSALQVIGKTLEEILDYGPPELEHQAFKERMEKHIDRYDKKDKAWIVGYNSHFDDAFLREWFLHCGDKFYGSLFHWPPIDVSVLAAMNFLDNKHELPNFQLMTVAENLGVEVEKEEAHDALYDAKITHLLFKELTR